MLNRSPWQDCDVLWGEILGGFDLPPAPAGRSHPGRGARTFTGATSSPATGVQPTPIAVGDFNGDGRLDMATGNVGTSNVPIVLQRLLPSVVTSPGSVTFDSQTVRTASPLTAVTLTNHGSASLTVSGISITGADRGDFAETDNCPTLIVR